MFTIKTPEQGLKKVYNKDTRTMPPNVVVLVSLLITLDTFHTVLVFLL